MTLPEAIGTGASITGVLASLLVILNGYIWHRLLFALFGLLSFWGNVTLLLWTL